LIKYIKSVLWRVAKCLSYIEEARCLKVKGIITDVPSIVILHYHSYFVVILVANCYYNFFVTQNSD